MTGAHHSACLFIAIPGGKLLPSESIETRSEYSLEVREDIRKRVLLFEEQSLLFLEKNQVWKRVKQFSVVNYPDLSRRIDLSLSFLQ